MGKIRIKTIGDEALEKEQQEEAKKRKEAKKFEKKAEKASVNEEDLKKEKTDQKELVKKSEDKKIVQKRQENKKQKHSTKYYEKIAKLEKNRVYSLKEALKLLPSLRLAKFDETVELHLNTVEKGISGNVTLPHGTGKKKRVVIASAQDSKKLDELIKQIENGQIQFDVLIATPDAMPRLARVAKILGPRGLMPNPKNGTVTTKPEEVAKQFEAGQIHFKTEAKFPLLHIPVGKISFGEEKLEENIKSIIQAVQIKNIKKATLKSTMSPGIQLDLNSLDD